MSNCVMDIQSTSAFSHTHTLLDLQAPLFNTDIFIFVEEVRRESKGFF